MLKKSLLKMVCNAAKSVAVKSCGQTSFLDFYQPKEPAMLRKMKEEKK